MIGDISLLSHSLTSVSYHHLKLKKNIISKGSTIQYLDSGSLGNLVIEKL